MTKQTIRSLEACAVAVGLGLGPAVGAQTAGTSVSIAHGADPSSHPLRFLAQGTDPAQAPRPVDAALLPELRRLIALDVHGVTRERALAEIGRVSGLSLVYASDLIAAPTLVTLADTAIPVSSAVEAVLAGLPLDAVIERDGTIVLRAQAAPVIRGTVRDQVSHLPLPGATVSLLDEKDSALMATVASNTGQFSIRIPSGGVYAINVRFLGYTGLTTEPTEIGVGDTVTTELHLSVATPVTLDPVYTKANPESEGLGTVALGRIVLGEHYRLGKGIFVAGWKLERSGMSLTEFLGHEPGVKLSGLKPSGTPVVPGAGGQFLVAEAKTWCLYARIDHWSVLRLLIQDFAANIDQLAGVKNVMAVEFYQDANEVPKEWQADAAPVELWTRSNTLATAYTGPCSGDRYTIGSTEHLDVGQMVRRDTVEGDQCSRTFPVPSRGFPVPTKEGYGALPAPNSLAAPACGFMQIWTKAAW